MDPSQPIFTNKNLAAPKNWEKKLIFQGLGLACVKQISANIKRRAFLIFTSYPVKIW